METNYSKDGDDFIFVPVKKETDRMKKIGFIVDTYEHIRRGCLVTKHGDWTRIKKNYRHSLKEIIKGKNDKAKLMARALVLIDVTTWELSDINHCVVNVILPDSIIKKYKIQIL